METIEYQSQVVIHNLEELTEICKAAGAAASTVIYSTDKVVVFYRDPQTRGIPDNDFVDEIRIRHLKNARLQYFQKTVRIKYSVLTQIDFNFIPM